MIDEPKKDKDEMETEDYGKKGGETSADVDFEADEDQGTDEDMDE